jgi:hypothetical protein
MNEIKGLESNTQSNLIQTKHQSQTEGLLTSHSSDLQLLTLNIDHYPIMTVKTITQIIVYFVPQPTIIAKTATAANNLPATILLHTSRVYGQRPPPNPYRVPIVPPGAGCAGQ